MVGNVVMLYCGGSIYDSTSIRRPFDCLSKVINVTVTVSSDVNKDWTCKDKDKDKNQAYKDQDKDLTHKDKDKDKD